MRAEAVYTVELFLTVYILLSLSITPVLFLVTTGINIIISKTVPILSNRYSFL